MAVNLYGDTDIQQRTNTYAEVEMLAHAMPVMVLEKVAKPVRMPKNKSNSITFRRPNVLAAATTALTEGVPPASIPFGYDDVSATLAQHGQVIEISDLIADTHEDPVLQDATVQCGENIGRTKEALDYGVFRAGTSVFYANGTSRANVNTPISLTLQRKVTRFLKLQKARKFTRILAGSEDFDTSPIEASFLAVAHTDCESDVRSMTGFTPTAEYGTRSVICPEEIGAVEDCRYILSPDLDPFITAGSGTANGMVATGGQVDVYPVMYFGQEAVASVALRGMGAITPQVIPANKIEKSDPLGQKGLVGWKMYHAAIILNQLWMARLEVGVSEL